MKNGRAFKPSWSILAWLAEIEGPFGRLSMRCTGVNFVVFGFLVIKCTGFNVVYGFSPWMFGFFNGAWVFEDVRV